MQAICRPNGKFSDILERFPSSVHDSRIWKLSQAGIFVENNFLVREHILGDCGYILSKYLLTPYRQPISVAQENYNYAHKKTRVLVEQAFGRWKRRFHCLHVETRMAPDRVCVIIVACAVLHNMAIDWKEPMLEDTAIDQHSIDESPAMKKRHTWLPSITEINSLFIISAEHEDSNAKLNSFRCVDMKLMLFSHESIITCKI